ncbi:GNAT family N-acetyltransferase [Thalassotalea ganghwensis]
MDKLPEIFTENLVITILKPEEYWYLLNYEKHNQSHLAQWEPLREESYYNDKTAKERVKTNYQNFLAGTCLPFVGLDKKTSEVLALATFSNIVYGVFRACNLGYSIDERYQGKQLMHEMLSASIDYVFNELKLHRIMANYMPSNIRSANLLQRLGFEQEGLAKSYLKIAGQWQDHILTSKINPNDL